MVSTRSPSRLVDDPAAALVDDAARRGERWVSLCRALFCLAMLGRGLGIGVLDHPRAMVGPPAELFAIAFSAWSVWRTWRGRGGTAWFAASVVVDAGVCFVVLLTNALWPYAGYRGVLSVTDGAALLITVIAAGFRLSPRVAVLGAVLNGLSAVALVTVDTVVAGVRYPTGTLVLIAIFGVAGAAIAISLATQTRSLATATGLASAQAARARQSLGALLQDHHDVRSVLSSATLNAALLVRELDDTKPSAATRARAATLQSDLEAVGGFVSTLKEGAYRALSAAAEPSDVDIKGALAVAQDAASRRFPEVQVADEVPRGLGVYVAGGAVALERLLLNLLVNACEGDGQRGAARVVVRAELSGRTVRLVVDDDGPGFHDAVLRGALARAQTTKDDGSGLGLLLVHTIATASHGTVSLQRSARGGASVEVRLPVARGETASAAAA